MGLTARLILCSSLASVMSLGCGEAGNGDPSTASSAGAEDPAALGVFLAPDPTPRETLVSEFAARNDQRIIPPLLLVMRFSQMGAPVPALSAGEMAALRELSGEDFGADWAAWSEWWWRQADAPPNHPGYAFLHAALHSLIDPRFNDILWPEMESRVRRDTIVWGGVRLDGIPALVNPEAVPADDAAALVFSDDEPVFAVTFNGESRAYPLRIMDWHEMVNDSLGGQDFLISYCTLCGAAVAYDAQTEAGRLEFGSSGFLRRSNKVMYDRQTRTLWSALEGVPIIGPIVRDHPDLALRRLPVVRTTWGEWRRRHPETSVITLNTGHERDYTPGQPYGDYFAAPDTMFPVAERSDLMATKDWIYAMILDGQPKAYPLEAFESASLTHDEHAGHHLLLMGDVGRLEVRAYETDGRRFTMTDDGELQDAEGGRWTLTEEALLGPAGESFPRLAGHLAFWFGWYAAHQDTAVFGATPSAASSDH